MDNSPFNKLTMDAQDKTSKIQALTSIILDLKKSNVPNSKKTIQKLQQEINVILYNEQGINNKGRYNV